MCLEIDAPKAVRDYVHNALRLNKAQRINQRKRFQQIFKCARPLNGSFCAIYYQKNQLHSPRLGIVVSKRSLPLAIKRNRFKRLVRECFRHSQADITSCDIVVIARKRANLATKQEVRGCLNTLFQQLLKQPCLEL